MYGLASRSISLKVVRVSLRSHSSWTNTEDQETYFRRRKAEWKRRQRARHVYYRP